MNELLTRTQGTEEMVRHPLRYNLLHQKYGNSDQHKNGIKGKVKRSHEQSSRVPSWGRTQIALALPHNEVNKKPSVRAHAIL